VTGEDPKAAAVIARAVVSKYMQLEGVAEEAADARRLAILEQELNEVARRLRDQYAQLHAFARYVPPANPPE